MLIVAVLSARELTVALQYRLAADTMYMYIYGAMLVRIDSRQTRIKKHIVSFLFPFPFFFFTSSRTEKYKVKSTKHFNISEGTIFSTKHFRLCAHANTSVSVGEIFNAAGDDRKSR